jgi:hypothetical protein
MQCTCERKFEIFTEMQAWVRGKGWWGVLVPTFTEYKSLLKLSSLGLTRRRGEKTTKEDGGDKVERGGSSSRNRRRRSRKRRSRRRVGEPRTGIQGADKER